MGDRDHDVRFAGARVRSRSRTPLGRTGPLRRAEGEHFTGTEYGGREYSDKMRRDRRFLSPVRTPSPRRLETSPTRDLEAVLVEDGTYGRCTKWELEKGYGFLKPDNGWDEIFCHRNAIRDGSSLNDGDRVKYKAFFDPERGNFRAEQVFGGHYKFEREYYGRIKSCSERGGIGIVHIDLIKVQYGRDAYFYKKDLIYVPGSTSLLQQEVKCQIDLDKNGHPMCTFIKMVPGSNKTPELACRDYDKRGECRYGNNCRFKHMSVNARAL